MHVTEICIVQQHNLCCNSACKLTSNMPFDRTFRIGSSDSKAIGKSTIALKCIHLPIVEYRPGPGPDLVHVSHANIGANCVVVIARCSFGSSRVQKMRIRL